MPVNQGLCSWHSAAYLLQMKGADPAASSTVEFSADASTQGHALWCMYLTKVGQPGSSSCPGHTQPCPPSGQIFSSKQVGLVFPKVHWRCWPAQEDSQGHVRS